mgnify:CR=1 FL=1
MSKQRAYFRVEYPNNDRPNLRINSDQFTIMNLSEKGLLVVNDTNGKPLKVGKEMAGTVVFGDKEEVVVKGTILRETAGKVAVVLTDGIPLHKIMTEQRYLINRYGTLRQPGQVKYKK